jgi:hypothetical protein
VNNVSDRDVAVLPSKHDSKGKLDVFLNETHSSSHHRNRIRSDRFRRLELWQWVILVALALLLLIGVAFVIIGVGDEVAAAVSVFDRGRLW